MSETSILRKNAESDLETALSKVSRWGNADFFFNTLLDQTAKFVSRNLKTHPTRVKVLLDELKKRFPNVLEFVLVNSEGVPVTDLCDGPVPRSIVKKSYFVLLGLKNGNDGPLKKDWRLLKSFFGSQAQLGDVGFNRLQRVSFQREKALLYISVPNENGILFCHLSKPPDWETMGIRDRIKTFNRRSKGIRLGLFDSRLGMPPMDLPSDFSKAFLNDIVSAWEKEPTSFFHEKGWCWGIRRLGERFLTIGGGPVSAPQRIERRRRVIGVLFFLLFIFLAAWAGKVMSGGITPSLRAKVILVFFFTSVYPLGFLALSAKNYLAERQTVLEENLFASTAQGLRIFDENFSHTLAEIQQIVNRSTKQPLKSGALYLGEMENRIGGLLRKVNPSWAWTCDQQGNFHFPTGLPIPFGAQDHLKKARQAYLDLIEKLNSPSSLHPGDQSTLTPKNVVDPSKRDDFFAQLWNSLSTIHEVGLAGKEVKFQGLFPMYDSERVCRYLVAIEWDHPRLEWVHLHRKLLRLSRQLPDTRFFALHQEDPAQNVPRFPGVRHPWNPFSRGISPDSPEVRSVFRKGEKTYLYTGIQGNKLQSYKLVGITSDLRIRTDQNRLRGYFQTVALLLLFIGLTTGSILARKFLTPVSELAEGIRMLKLRRTNVRLRRHDYDELGDLAQNFNTMMEDWKDLEVARQIQETLFPKGSLEMGAAKIFGSCTPALQVGGDYFDYFPLTEHSFAAVIGDVSGHGIPAAMVAAMAKGILAHPENTQDPALVLKILHSVLLTTIKRKKMMTCCYGIIDTRIGTFQFANGGHLYPVLVRGGMAEFVPNSGSPLGIKKDWKGANAQISLVPGDILILLTDGLVEALDTHGSPLGYSRFQKALPGLRDFEPERMEKAIRNWFQRETGGGEPEDDITMVIIRYGIPKESQPS